jgi:hypothetical protein
MLHLHKPTPRNNVTAELYASEASSTFVTDFASWGNRLGGGNLIPDSILKAYATASGPGFQVGEIGLAWNGGDGPRQIVVAAMERFDGSFIGFEDILDQTTSVLTHQVFDTANGVDNGFKTQTSGVASLFTVGGIFDAQQQGQFVFEPYNGNTYVFSQFAVTPDGRSAWDNTFNPELQKMMGTLAPYGTVTNSDQQAFYDNINVHFDADPALLANAPSGTPLYVDVQATLE